MKSIVRLIGLLFSSMLLCACVMYQTNSYSSTKENTPAQGNSKEREGIHIYLNPATGNDAHDGTKPVSAKKTIQVAWDSLPALIDTNVTIHLSDGVYKQTAHLKGKTVLNDKTITLSGNIKNPDAVRITSPGTIFEDTGLEQGFCLTRQTNVACEGIRFDSFGSQAPGKPSGVAIRIQHESGIAIRNCVFTMNGVGVEALSGSHYTLTDSQFTSESVSDNTYGVFMGEARGNITNSSFKNFRVGIQVTHQSRCRISNSTLDGCGNACCISYLSDATFEKGNIISNSTITAVDSAFNAIAQFATNPNHVKYINNKQNTNAAMGGLFCD